MAKPHVVFVTGDHEYGGEETMPLLAAELVKNYAMDTTVLRAFPDQNAEENIPGLEWLSKADLAVFFLRWRRLPAEQAAHIEACVKSGKPVMGFRTTSHSFKYPPGHPLEHWNGWAADTFGAPPGWGADGHTHYGHQSTTDVSVIPAAAEHPVMKGVTGPFHVRSWLYHVVPKWPPADATPLLLGKAINPRIPAPDNPVAWVWTNKHGGRAFFTTLGHPEDFQAEPLLRLVVNAVHWCLGQPIPDPWKGPFKMDAPYQGMRKPAPVRPV
ncbi:MAG: ThuA domain-containing protein [Planctomycetes bacterium]|nr:ThuA domain-containing protein [Planctomycetota bacterium]